jgi:hypothetical protein
VELHGMDVSDLLQSLGSELQGLEALEGESSQDNET